MRIVQVIAPSNFGGAESVCLSLAVALQDIGVETTVAVLLHDESSTTFLEGAARLAVGVTQLRVSRNGYHRAVLALRELVLARDASVVHSHLARANLVARGAAALTGRPCVATLHGHSGIGVRGRFYDLADHALLRTMSAVVSVSHAGAREIHAWSPRFAAALEIVPSAIAPQRLIAKRDALRVLGVPEGVAVVAWIGRLAPEKDPEMFVRSVAELALTDRALNEWHAVVVGDGALLDSARRLAAALGVGCRISFCGAHPNAGTLLSAVDVVAITSIREQLPTVLLEALLHGVPVVSTDVGDVRRIAELSGAVIVTAASPSCIASSIADLLSSPHRRERMALSGSSYVSRHHDPFLWADRHRQLYARLLHRRAPRMITDIRMHRGA